MEDYLKSSAASYDYGKGFFQPSRAQMLDSTPGQNFGVMASTALRQQMRVRDWSKGKFNAPGYFLHFFLGMALSVQQSKKLRKEFGIDKIFYRTENEHILKMFILGKQEDSSDKLMMKCISFGENKLSDWSDKDFIEIVSKIGPNIKSYQFESHYYHIDFIKDVGSASNTEDELLSFFIETNYDLNVKIKPSNIKAGQRKVESRFYEIASPQKEDIAFTEDYFDGMLSNPGKPAVIKQFVKDFSNQVIIDFKTYSKIPQPITEANAGFMHGYMFPFQKKFNFKPEVIQSVSDQTTAQFYIQVQKKFSSDWKYILYDYPFKLHIVDISADMDRSSIEKRVVEVMVQSHASEQPSTYDSFSDKILLTFLNFNAQSRTVAQNEVKVATSTVYDPILSLTGIAGYMKPKNIQGKEDLTFKSASDFLSKKFLEEILLKSLKIQNLCIKDSRCLSRFMHGLLSSGKYKAYIVRPKDETDFEKEHVTNFVFETEEPEIHALVTLHEDGSFPEDYMKEVEGSDRKVPHLSKKSKYIVHFNIFASYDPLDLEFKTRLKPVKLNTDCIIEAVSQIDFRPKANLAINIASKMNQFLESKINLFRNYNDFAAFAVGMFHDLQSLVNVVRPGPNTMQLAYVVQNRKSDKLVLANFVFGKDEEEVSKDVKIVLRLVDETISRKMSDMVRIVCFTMIQDSETKAQKAEFLTEKDLLSLKACKKSRRKRRTFCIEKKPVSEEKRDSTMQVSEKVDFVTKLGKISNGVMTGMMVKSLIADMIQGNMAGVAINIGFVLFNLLAQAGSIRMVTKGAELTKEGRLILGSILQCGASFLARTPSFLFIGYDLYSNLHVNDSSPENKVAIGTDTAYLAIDFAETAIELAEAFGVIQGVSSVTGPIGWTIGATLVVGSDIYKAVKQVERIDAIIPLTALEKVLQGLRGFIGLKPSSSISNLISAEQWNLKNIQQTLDMLSKHKSIYRMIVPAKTIEGCHSGKRMNFTAPKQWVQPSRTVPKLQNGFSYFCTTPFYCERPKISDFVTILATSKVLTHSCLSAVGIQSWKAESTNHTYYQLADGDDNVVAFKGEFNTFDMGNGRKIITGGDKDDIFLLGGNQTYGLLDGGLGKNLLDVANVKLNATLVLANFSLYSLGKEVREEIDLQVYNFHQFHGRANQRDFVVPWCSMDKIDTFGGSEYEVDYILVPDSHCTRHLAMNIHPDTYIVNEAVYGEFSYQVKKFQVGASIIKIKQSTDTATHVFTFDYNLFDISAVRTLWRKQMKRIVFTMDNGTKFGVESSSWDNMKFVFKDGVHLHIRGEAITAVLNTTDDLAWMEDLYASVISASTISMVIHDNSKNETPVISRGRHQRGGARSISILHSSADHKSRLKGSSKQENVFIVVPYRDSNSNNLKFHSVFVKATSSKNLIDLTKIRNRVITENSDLKMNLLTENINTTLIEVLYDNSNTESKPIEIGRLTIDHSDSRDNIILIANGPMNLKFRDNAPYLESVPLHFNELQNIVILSEQNIQSDTKIFIDKQLGSNYTFFVHNHTLILSNLPIDYDNFPCGWVENISRDSIVVIMIDYFESDMMKNLVFEFKDLEFKPAIMPTLKVAEMDEFLGNFDLKKCICHSIMKLPLPDY